MQTQWTNDAYRYGSLTRGDLKGDILYGVASFAGLEVLITPAFAFVHDRWLERHRAVLEKEKAEEMSRWMQENLKSVGDDVFFEDILGAVLEQRRRLFAPDMLRLFLRDAEHPDVRTDLVDYSQADRLDSLMRACDNVCFFLQDPRLASLMRADLDRARKTGRRLLAVYSETARGVFPFREEFRSLFPDKDILLIPCEGPLDANATREALEREHIRGSSLLLYYGEKGLTDLRNLACPALVRCIPESLLEKTLAGQSIRSGRCDVYIPPCFDILPLVPLRRRTLASFRQLAYLSREKGDGIYAMPISRLYRDDPRVFFSVYDEASHDLPAGARWPEGEAGDDWYADFCSRRDRVLSGMLEQLPGVRKLGGWFRLDTFEQLPPPWSSEGKAEGILVHGVLLDRARDAQVVLSQDEPVSPRALAQSFPEEGTGLMLNYLFFLTPRLSELYQRLRSDRPWEQAPLPGGHLDYMLRRDEGTRLETFPLYRKACMAMREDGTFAFFHFRLGGGIVKISGRTLRWEREDVDPPVPGEIAVYTPYLSCPDEGAPKYTYTRSVGQGRVNLVIVQDRILCVRDGDVLLPCMGVVLSLKRESGLPLLRACGIRQGNDAGFTWEHAPELEIRLDPPEDFSREEWEKIRWAYGGGLTLIHRGENCFATPETSALHLSREGWSSPLSAQTQESDIASMVRHPRTAFGLTKQGQLFALVFSGRSSVSAGADYREMCRIAQILVPDVTEMMNVDGGGSSVLGITWKGRFIEFSWPSSSPSTPAGMVRPVHSIFRITL